MKNLATLVAARAKIADRRSWTQGVLGRDEYGLPVNRRSLDKAVCYCASGALFAVGAEAQRSGDAWDALERAMPQPGSITSFNDSHEHEEVLALFDKAIAMERER